MNTRRLTLIAAALSVSVFSLSALAGPGGKHMRGEHRELQPVVINEARENFITEAASIDSNGDGRIDAAELRAYREKERAEREQQHFLARYDSNGDGVVSTDEYVSVRQDRLTTLDADGDGTVTVEEFRQGHRGHRGSRHGGDSN